MALLWLIAKEEIRNPEEWHSTDVTLRSFEVGVKDPKALDVEVCSKYFP